MSAVVSRPLSHQRRCVGVYFGLLGIAVGVWVTRLPEIQAKLHLDDGRLGIVLLMSALGALIAMPLSGRIAGRFGTRPLIAATAAAICVLVPLIAAAPSVPILMGVFGVFGMATGIYGVVLNAMGVDVEVAYARPILSTFHGLFSLGGLIGALIAAGCMAGKIGPVASLVGASVAIAAAYVIAGPGLPAAALRRSGSAPGAPRRALPPARLVLLGGFALLGLVGEGSMGDWSAIYLERSLGASSWLAGLGYAAFSLGMTSGRFAGDALSGLVGDVGLLRGGACLASAGLGGAILLGHPVAAVVGFALVGAGLANAVPVLYRAAAGTPGIDPVAGIATTSTVGYFGFLAGPPLIGLIAHRTTLGTALTVVAAAIALVAVGGQLVRAVEPTGPPRAPDLGGEPAAIEPA